MVCQAEKGEKEGTVHLQGYIQLERSQELTWVRNKISNRAHWEIMRAHNSDTAREYCMKTETRIDGPWEFGTYEKVERGKRGRQAGCSQGKRTDIEAFRDAILGGMNEMELWGNFPTQMAKFPRMYAQLHNCPKVRVPPDVVLLVGPTGVGKTKWFFDHCPESDWYSTPVSNGTLWMDGYRGQKWVLIDDFSGQMPLVQLLRMLDRYPITVPIKGSHVDFSPARTIVLTTNLHPTKWYKWCNRELQYDALARRFTQVNDYTSGTLVVRRDALSLAAFWDRGKPIPRDPDAFRRF